MSRALCLTFATALTTFASGSVAQSFAADDWTVEQARVILDDTKEVELDADLSHASEARQRAVESLLRAGEILHDLYLDQLHPDALNARRRLQRAAEEPGQRERAEALLALFEQFRGPILTTPANHREPFVAVAPERPGKHLYPEDLGREEFEAYLEAHPEQREELLDLRSVVRRATAANVARDLSTLDRHPALSTLHPGLVGRLDSWSHKPDATRLYAVPYALEWADELFLARRHLLTASDAIRDEDKDYAAYLRRRADDLLTGDYESGDAAWVAGRFSGLDGQIGSYETYDDALAGVRAFYSLAVLIRDDAETELLAAGLAELQGIQDSLPMEGSRRVRSDLPVGVYHVLADFGQARSTNTATILPNDADHARKYGRRIMLRFNVLTHPDLYENRLATFEAALVEAQAEDLTLRGNYLRTLWHEIGHYLGVLESASGEPPLDALGAYGNAIEEMKADLVSLLAIHRLTREGVVPEAELRGVQADGIARTLQAVEPRRAQAYQTMQLMQNNYFLDRGLLRFTDGERYEIDYERYEAVVRELLGEVLALQAVGDPAQAEAFVERWARWTPAHQVVAERIQAAREFRYHRPVYPALERLSGG